MSQTPENLNQKNEAFVVGGNVIATNAIGVVAGPGASVQVHVAAPGPLPERVWYNVKEPIEEFIGRELFLTALKKSIIEKNYQADKSRITGRSLSTISSKNTEIQGGQGKTEVIRKFIRKNRENFFNVVWIDAGSGTRAKDSFRRLAETTLKISLVDQQEQKVKPFHTVQIEIYEMLLKQTCLIVFDNAEDLMAIESFLPLGFDTMSADTNGNGLAVIIICSSGSLSDGGSVQNIQKYESAVNFQLENFNLYESTRFLAKKLELEESLSSQNQNTGKIPETEKLSGLSVRNPLMLKYAVCFIDQQTKRHPSYSIQNFIQDYEETLIFLLSNYPTLSNPTFPLVLLHLTRRRILENHHEASIGLSALKIMSVLPLLVSEKIPKELLTTLFDGLISQEIVVEALDVLKGYSIIKEVSTSNYEVHRLTQISILEILAFETSESTRNEMFHNLKRITINFQTILQSKTPKNSMNYRDFVINGLSFMNHVSSGTGTGTGATAGVNFGSDDTFVKFFRFMAGVVKSFDPEEWIQVLRQMKDIQAEQHGASSEEATDVQDRLAFALSEQGRGGEAVGLFMDVVQQRVNTFGWNDPVSFGIKLLETGRDIHEPNHPNAVLAESCLRFLNILNVPGTSSGTTQANSTTGAGGNASSTNNTPPPQQNKLNEECNIM